MDDLHTMINEKTGSPQPMLSDFHHGIIMKNADKLNSAIIYDRDFSYNYFGFKVSLEFLSLFYYKSKIIWLIIYSPNHVL